VFNFSPLTAHAIMTHAQPTNRVGKPAWSSDKTAKKLTKMNSGKLKMYRFQTAHFVHQRSMGASFERLIVKDILENVPKEVDRQWLWDVRNDTCYGVENQ
jgi:hypothetical protein